MAIRSLLALLTLTLALAPSAVAASKVRFSGGVNGDGISARYTVAAEGKKACVTLDDPGTTASNPIEDLSFTARDGKKKVRFTHPDPAAAELCKKERKFAAALRETKTVKAVAFGQYGGTAKGTLKR